MKSKMLILTNFSRGDIKLNTITLTIKTFLKKFIKAKIHIAAMRMLWPPITI